MKRRLGMPMQMNTGIRIVYARTTTVVTSLIIIIMAQANP